MFEQAADDKQLQKKCIVHTTSVRFFDTDQSNRMVRTVANHIVSTQTKTLRFFLLVFSNKL